jgi:hypothetical protein
MKRAPHRVGRVRALIVLAAMGLALLGTTLPANAASTATVAPAQWSWLDAPAEGTAQWSWLSSSVVAPTQWSWLNGIGTQQWSWLSSSAAAPTPWSWLNGIGTQQWSWL